MRTESEIALHNILISMVLTTNGGDHQHKEHSGIHREHDYPGDNVPGAKQPIKGQKMVKWNNGDYASEMLRESELGRRPM